MSGPGAEDFLAAMDDGAFDAVADEGEADSLYGRGRSSGRAAHAEDRAESESLSELALRTLGRVRACAGAERDDFKAGFLAGVADAAGCAQEVLPLGDVA